MLAASATLVPVGLEETARRVIHLEAPEAADGQFEVNLPHTVLAAPALLERALANLVRNALRHAGTQGPIYLNSSQTGDMVSLIISDCGPGIPEADLPNIFKPFYRPDISRVSATGGAGLGLSIVKSAIEACGGSVTMENRQPSGLQVTLRLKAAG
jgi:two-component system sensor histidine kinase CpxA